MLFLETGIHFLVAMHCSASLECTTWIRLKHFSCVTGALRGLLDMNCRGTPVDHLAVRVINNTVEKEPAGSN